MLALSTVILCLAGPSLAESTNSGAIRGTVTDPTSAVIPDVKVTVSKIDTGVSKDYATNSAGLYDTVSILPHDQRRQPQCSILLFIWLIPSWGNLA